MYDLDRLTVHFSQFGGLQLVLGRNDVTLDYYIFHLFFAELSKQYPDMIANMPYGFASACLQLRNNLGKRYSEEIWNKICSLSNFHKMSPRVSGETQSKRDSFYQYLTKRT